MAMQDIYFGVQTGLQLLIGGGVVWAAFWLSGVLKRAIESQEKTIAAQAEQMKAQSTVLQDFERLNKMMKEVIDTVDAPAMLQRLKSYKGLVDQEAQDQLKRLQTQFQWAMNQTASTTVKDMLGFVKVINYMLPFFPPELRRVLIEESDLPPYIKEGLLGLARSNPYIPNILITAEPSMAQIMVQIGQLSGPTRPPQEPQADQP
jgi:hypothetical protein